MSGQTEENSRIRALFANAGAAIVEYVFRDGGPVVVDANERFEEVFGYETDEVVGEPIDECIVLPERENEAETLNRRVIEGKQLSTEVQRKAHDGVRTFLLRNAPIETDGKTRGYAIYTDITDRKERERTLESYEKLFEKTTDCIVETEFTDGEPIITRVNEAFENVFGYSEAEITGRSLDELIVPDRFQEEAQEINKQGKQGEDVVTREVTRMTADGLREFLLRSIHFADDLSYAVYTDITARKQRERTLERQNERLEQFASLVSHDLRNPLGIARTYVDLARESGEESDFDVIQEAHERMDAMIEDLLTMARAETTVETRESVNLHALATEAWETAQTGDATLELLLSPEATLAGDRDLLRHVFENLFRNAAKHGPGEQIGTEITVTTGVLDSGDGFYVEDDGTGIEPDCRNEIFEHGYTTSDDGTGLGLWIVDDFITAHGWEIEITDGSDGGARFEIRTGDDADPGSPGTGIS